MLWRHRPSFSLQATNRKLVDDIATICHLKLSVRDIVAAKSLLKRHYVSQLLRRAVVVVAAQLNPPQTSPGRSHPIPGGSSEPASSADRIPTSGTRGQREPLGVLAGQGGDEVESLS